MQYQGTVAAWAADVVPAGGKEMLFLQKDGKLPAFRWGMLTTVGLEEDVSRPSRSFKLQES